MAVLEFFRQHLATFRHDSLKNYGDVYDAPQ
jgi:hypothetical protein